MPAHSPAEIHTLFRNAFNLGDIEALTALYEPDAILVPSTAVQTGPEGQYVYVIGEELTAELRRVTVKRTEGERTIIAVGLSPGERVVTRGQLRLGPKVRVQITQPGEAPS